MVVKASPEVAQAIHQASVKTGVDFKYLVAQAGQESSFRPDLKATTSSARGLYQFIESTWLNVIRDKGAEHGLGDYASQIDGNSAAPRVADPSMRRKILELRYDPNVASAMAAEYAKSNKGQLERDLGRRVNPTELYMAHFLGPNGATRFLNTLDRSPTRTGADLLPEAAAANRGAFYDKQGRALSVKQIYDSYAAKFDGELQSTPSTPVGAPTAPPFQPPSVASIVRATLMSALAGDSLSPVTVQALMQLDVPGALARQSKNGKT
jgi:hypothetical protein